VGELDQLETFVGSKKAARLRAAERHKGLIHYLRFWDVPVLYVKKHSPF
jgi:hypothetical protein